MGEEEIGAVKEFPYLGSVVAASGRIDSDIDNRIAKASKAFGALRRAVFLDKNLTLRTKQKIYQACVLSVLLYGAECWILLRKHKRKLNSFHHRCIRIILGISNRQQWSSHISMAEIRMRWGDLESATDKVQKRRLEWLGHLARMESARIPKSILFGWLPQPRPRCGPRKRWRDEIRTDLKEIKVPECDWYKTATTSRSAWKTAYKQGVANLVEAQLASSTQRPQQAQRQFQCEVCSRSFRRDSDRKRHKCTSERSKPVCQQKGAALCQVCQRWFRSKGGLAVHTCRPTGTTD